MIAEGALERVPMYAEASREEAMDLAGVAE